MKVAIIGSRGLGNSYSGIEKVLAHLCPRIAALGHEVHVFGEAGAGVEPRPGIRQVDVPALRGKYTETLSRSGLSVLLAMARGYDVINLVAVGPGVLSAVPHFAGTPVVVSIHGLDWARDKWPAPARLALRAAERSIVRFADEITVVSQELVRYFRQAYGREVVYTPNGLDPAAGAADPGILAELGLRPGDYALFASRLVPEKGAHELVEAFQRIRTERKLVIAGGGRYDQGYVDALRAADRTGRCVFTGHLEGPRLEHLFRGACLYVLPSHIEGLSLSLLEAMSFGKALLVSDIAENLEVIGDAGATFPVGDVDGLAAALEKLLAAPCRLRELETRAAARARDLHSWDLVAASYAEVYHRIARSDRRSLAAGSSRPDGAR